MLLFLSLFGIFLSLLLLVFNARKHGSAIYLGAYFFILNLYGLIQHIMLYSGSVFLVSIAEVHFSALFFLPGPMLYWYVRSVIYDNPSLRKSDLWHLIPSVIYLIAALPYFFSPYSYKLQVAKAIINDPGYLGTHSHTILSDLISNTGVFAGRPFLLFVYSIIACVLLFIYLNQKHSPLAFRHLSFMKIWLILFLGFQTLLVTAQLIIMLRTFVGDASDLFYTINILQVISALALTGLLITPFFFPQVLYGLPHYPEAFLASVTAVTLPDDQQEEKKEINRYSLDKDYIVYIKDKVETCMNELHPYCDTNFSVASLSVLTSIPAYHITFYLKTIEHSSFSDFRNAYRVRYAKKMMLDGKMKEMTFEAIGISSGFTNRSTFYRVFKNAEGITPGEFALNITSPDPEK